MAFIDKVKKAAEQPKKTQTPAQNSAPKQTSTNNTTTTQNTQSSTPSLDGNGNGASSLQTSNKFEYENSSIFDDSNNKSGKEAMQAVQGNSFFKGRSDAKQTGRMLKQLNQIQTDCSRWNVTMDADGDGTKTTTSLAQTIADSYDSVLDLYISEQVEAMMDKYGTGTNHGGYLSDAALEELAMKGIRADSVGDNSNRIYSFSLIDVKDDIKSLLEKEVKTDAEKKQIWDAVYADDAVVMKDSNGKKGSCIFADCLVPDGSAQKSEINLASILDQMGYDCISKADFVGKESEYMELISKVEANINDGSYHELNKGQQAQTIKDTYGKVGSVRQALNTLWKHDTAGKGGSKFAHGLGDGSDAHISNDFSDSTSSENGTGMTTDELMAQQNEEVLYEGKDFEVVYDENGGMIVKKITSGEENKEEKLANKPKIEREQILRFAEKQMEKLMKESYKDTESKDLTKANKLDISDKIVNLINEEFKTKMTAEEIYDTIF